MNIVAQDDAKQQCRKVSLVFCLVAVGVLGFVSCRRPVAMTTKPAAGGPAGPADEAIDSAREALAKQNDLASCRAAIQQLNVQLGRHPEQKPQLEEKEK